MVVNVINLPHRTDRLEHFKQQAKEQGFEYKIWEGIIKTPSFVGIHKSHKKIVQDAKDKGLPYCIIAEDDICFPDTGAFDYYISKMPDDFDLYLGCVYYGILMEEDNILKDFSSLILYTIHSRYYDTFLETPEEGHIDRSQIIRYFENGDMANPLAKPKGKFVLCDLFCAYQIEGFSDNSEKNFDNNITYLHNRKFYSSTQPFFTWANLCQRSAAATNALMASSS